MQCQASLESYTAVTMTSDRGRREEEGKGGNSQGRQTEKQKVGEYIWEGGEGNTGMRKVTK